MTAKTLLETKGCSLAICKESGSEVFFDHGIKPIITLLRENPDLLKDADVADKVVGRAAALLFVYGGIKRVHAAVISTCSKEIFDKHAVEYTFDTEAPRIKNRDGTGLCPMESRVVDISDPREAFDLLNSIIA